MLSIKKKFDLTEAKFKKSTKRVLEKGQRENHSKKGDIGLCVRYKEVRNGVKYAMPYRYIDIRKQ